MEDILDQIPGYREAVEKEREIREMAFLDFPELICGIEVKPLSTWHLALLDTIHSPFLTGETEIVLADCAMFCWMVSPGYQLALKIREALGPWSERLTNWIMNHLKRRVVKQVKKSGKTKEQ